MNHAPRVLSALLLAVTLSFTSRPTRAQDASPPSAEASGEAAGGEGARDGAAPDASGAAEDDDGVAGAPAPPALPPLAESLTGMARAEYQAARILYEDGDYQGALNKLKVAYEQSQDPRLLWNMAAAEKNLRHYARVMRLVDEYLAAGPPYVTPADAETARALVETVRGFVSEVTLSVEPAGALVTVDGEPAGQAPLPAPLVLDFGLRTLRVTSAGYVPWEEKLELTGGEPRAVAVALVREVNEGTLKVVTDAHGTIRIDGKVVGVGLWEGKLRAGVHTVQLEARGKVPTSTEVVIEKGAARVLNQPLRDEAVAKKRLPTWVWLTGGVAAAAAIGTGTYLATRGDPREPAVQQGSWGTLEF